MRLIDADLLQTALMDEYVGIAGYNTCAQFYRAIEIVRQQPTIIPPPNDPLTLEELREMNGEPVYIVPVDDDSIWCLTGLKNKVGLYIPYMYPGKAGRVWLWEDYGKAWLAYRRKPEAVS